MSEMPKSLCIACIFEIQNAYQLRVKATESDLKLREIYNTFEPQPQETDIFTREIKLEHGTLTDDNMVIKSEPWKAAELYNIDRIDLFKNERQLQSTSWPLNEDLSVPLAPTPKKTKGSKKEKIKKEPKPKKAKLPKLERLDADIKPQQRRERKRKLDSISTYVCVLCGKICNRKSIFEEHMFRHYNSRVSLIIKYIFRVFLDPILPTCGSSCALVFFWVEISKEIFLSNVKKADF
jgi:hypothetical protein